MIRNHLMVLTTFLGSNADVGSFLAGVPIAKLAKCLDKFCP